MTERLNSIIRAFEAGRPAFAAFSKLDRQSAAEFADSPYDGIVYEMEHNPYDVSALGDALQYMLNRKQIAESGSVAPRVTPLARIPANGAEMNQSFAKQVLDRGCYGVVWPHVATVEQAYNAVASCRYARPKNAPLYEPAASAATARPMPRATGACPWPTTTRRPTSGRWPRRANCWWA
ncbi:MAG: aldolase/citrate lyase family protein [Pseudorhodoferax sp.]